MKAFLAIASLVAAVSADHAPAPYRRPTPSYAPAPSYNRPSYAPARYAEPSYDAPAQYNYAYDVEDGYAGVDFDAQESRDGYATTGSYSVLLPDGRTQTVTYQTTDGYSGNVAEVTYSGEARYGYEAAPAYKPAPAYAPAPAYRPAPTYGRIHKRSAPRSYAPAPAYRPAPSYNRPSYAPASYAEPSYDAPAQYNYAYDVQDDYAGVDFDAQESRDGYATTGSYSVLLPDGRTQTVTYQTTDGYSGNVAEVTYSGEARYGYEAAPAYKPAPTYAPRPAYRPAPTYAPAPRYHA